MRRPHWVADRAGLPASVRDTLALERGERVLAAVPLEAGAGWLVATTYRLSWLGEQPWSRPWHLVDSATWNRDTGTLRVAWVGGPSRSRWSMDGDDRFLAALRERVQASVVLSGALDLGDRRTGRVAIRQDLATGQLVEQVVLGGQARPDDSEVVAEVARVRAVLRDEAGL